MILIKFLILNPVGLIGSSEVDCYIVINLMLEFEKLMEWVTEKPSKFRWDTVR